MSRHYLWAIIALQVVVAGCQMMVPKVPVRQLAFGYDEGQFVINSSDGIRLGSLKPKRQDYEKAVMSWHSGSPYVILEEEVGTDSSPSVSVGYIHGTQLREINITSHLEKLRAASPILIGIDAVFMGFDAKGSPVFNLGRERFKITPTGAVPTKEVFVDEPLRQTIEMK